MWLSRINTRVRNADIYMECRLSNGTKFNIVEKERLNSLL